MLTYTGDKELDDVLVRLAAAKSRDEYADVLGELATVAPNHIRALDGLFDSGNYYRMSLIWCLIGQTGPEFIELFKKAITDKDQFTRWAAAEALAKCRSTQASALLTIALKDRSHLVKATAVDAMAKFGDPAAIPQLKRIICSKHLQTVAPGIVKSARRALAVCEQLS